MQLKYGCTRIVLLHGRSAIKIAYLRPHYIFFRLLQLAKKKEVVDRLGRYDTNIIKAAIKYLLIGVLANRLEYKASQCDQTLTATTHKLFLGGIISIQERGSPASIEQAQAHPFWFAMMEECGCQRVAVNQFALFDGRVRLVDLGVPTLICPVLVYA